MDLSVHQMRSPWQSTESEMDRAGFIQLPSGFHLQGTAAMKANKKRLGKMLTAIICWEDRIKNDKFMGTVLILYSSGVVWAKIAIQPREGKVTYWKGKPRLDLSEMKKLHNGNEFTFAQEFRNLYKSKGYEVVSPLTLEALKKG